MAIIPKKNLFLILAIGLLPAARAWAQPSGAAPAPTDTGNESAGAAFQPGQPQPEAAAPQTPSEPIAAAPEVLEDAKKHFIQGVAFADAGNCEGAIAEFQAAYRLVPRPNALYNIGQCQERLFRYDLAIEYYERYLREAPADAPDRGAVEGALHTLQNLLGSLRIDSNVPAEVWADDRLVGKAPGNVLLPAGRHTVELRADGYIPSRTETQLVGREKVSISLKLIKARTTVHITEKTGLSPVVFWIGATATVITATVGGVFGFQVLSRVDEAKKIPALHPDREDAQKRVQKSELTADIFFASAAVLAIGTTIVAFLTDWKAEEKPGLQDKEADKLKTAMRVAPWLGEANAGLALQGALP